MANVRVRAKENMHTMFTVVMVGIWLMPLWHVMATLAAGVVGYLVLGHWPRPYIDDPSGMSFPIQAASAIWGISLIAFLSSGVAGIIGTPVYFWRRGWPIALLATFVYFAMWWFALLFVRADPFRIGDWIMD